MLALKCKGTIRKTQLKTNAKDSLVPVTKIHQSQTVSPGRDRSKFVLGFLFFLRKSSATGRNVKLRYTRLRGQQDTRRCWLMTILLKSVFRAHEWLKDILLGYAKQCTENWRRACFPENAIIIENIFVSPLHWKSWRKGRELQTVFCTDKQFYW